MAKVIYEKYYIFNNDIRLFIIFWMHEYNQLWAPLAQTVNNLWSFLKKHGPPNQSDPIHGL